MPVEVTGVDNMVTNLMGFGPTSLQMTGPELVAFAEDVITDAQENYVPVLTGTLMRSGDHDKDAKMEGDRLMVKMWFGGPGSGAELYAYEQHERFDFKHTVGGPKYLERPFLEHQTDLWQRISDALRRGWSGGGAGARTQFGSPFRKFHL